jgi:hypothetical protein
MNWERVIARNALIGAAGSIMTLTKLRLIQERPGIDVKNAGLLLKVINKEKARRQ